MRKRRPKKYTCLCDRCNLDFGSASAFDAHRVGKHDFLFDVDHLDGRRCLDPEEMRAKGMHKDSRGRWRRDGTTPNPLVTGVQQPTLWGATR